MAIKKVAFIGGGQMATALADGAIRQKMLAGGEICFVEPDAGQQQRLKSGFADSQIVASPPEVLADCQVVVLAIKPQILNKIGAELAKHLTDKHLVISIVAGIPLQKLQNMLSTQRIVRVMPNTPAQIGAGAAALSADETAAAEDVAWAENLMKSVGSCVRVPDHLMHAVTALSGSGPAYIYMIIESLSDGGVNLGLPREVATQLAAQTVKGAAEMVLHSGCHPGQLKDNVTSPGGTTIAGIAELETAAVRGAMMRAVAGAAQRSQELAN